MSVLTEILRKRSWHYLENICPPLLQLEALLTKCQVLLLLKFSFISVPSHIRECERVCFQVKTEDLSLHHIPTRKIKHVTVIISCFIFIFCITSGFYIALLKCFCDIRTSLTFFPVTTTNVFILTLGFSRKIKQDVICILP